MFARSVLRTAGRQAFRPATAQPSLFRASFKNSSKSNDPDVPVVSYQDGQRTESALHVPENGSTGPVAPPGIDTQKTATALKPNAYQHLTPTLSKFTLPNKVAIVTG